MRIKQSVAVAVLALGAGTAVAHTTRSDAWARFDDIQLPASRNKSEVLAELAIYQRSGLAELERGEHVDTFSNAHRLATARYAAMRSSQEFAMLVQVIAQRRGETVDLATSSPAAR